MSSVYSNNLEATNQILVSGYAVTSGVLAGLDPAVASAALASGNAALVLASSAQASGNAALVVGATAQASGNAGLVVGNEALASGNAALAIGGPSASTGVITSLTAGSDIASGYAVGLDANGRAVSVNKGGTDSLSVFATNYFAQAPSPQVTTGKDSSAYIESQNTWLFGYVGISAGILNSSGVLQCAQLSGNSLVYGAPVPVQRYLTGSPNLTAAQPKVYYIPGKDRGLAYTANTSRQPFACAVSVSNLTPSFGGLAYVNSSYNSAAGVNVNNDTSVHAAAVTNQYYLQLYPVSISGSSTAVVGTLNNWFPRCNAAPHDRTEVGTYCHDRINNRGVFVSNVGASGGYAGAIYPVTNTSATITPATNNNCLPTIITNSGISNICASVDYKNNGALVAYVNSDGSGNISNYNPGYGEALYLKFVNDTNGAFAVPSSPVVFNSAQTYTIGSTYDNYNNRFVLAWTDGNNLKASQVLVTSGNSLEVGTPTNLLSRQLTGSGYYGIGVCHASGTPYTLVTYGDGSFTASGFGCVLSGDSAKFFPHDSTLRSNVVGVAQTSAASGGTVTVALPGSISRIHSGLTPGKYVYPNYTSSGITTDGNIPNGWGQDPYWRPIGVAISSTEAAIINPILPE